MSAQISLIQILITLNLYRYNLKVFNCRQVRNW